MFKTSLCTLLGIEYPILQGAMAHISNGHLAGVVSEAGGLGVIATAFADAEFTRREIEIARSCTKKPFGVNIILENPRSKEVAQVCADEKVAVVTTGAGSPEPFIPILLAAGCKVIPVVPHVRAAKKMEALGVVALIAEGMEGGGHIGKMTTLSLIPQVVDAVDVPVLAAGGIADGRGFLTALMLGAVGVQMGTAFLVAEECDISRVYKEKVINALGTDITLTKDPHGKEVRCIKNTFTEQYEALVKRNASPEEILILLTGSIRRAVQGEDTGCYSAGQVAGLITETKPVAQIIEDIIADAEKVYANFKITYK